MREVVKKTLEEYKKAIESCANQYNSIIERKKVLELNPIIKEYNQLQKELDILKIKYDNLSEEYTRIYQLNCKHPLWYFMNDNSNRVEGRQEWVCQCVKCGITEIGHSKNFKNKLIIESGNMGFGEKCLSDYGVVRSEYLQLEASGQNDKCIARTMIKKYNNQKSKKH